MKIKHTLLIAVLVISTALNAQHRLSDNEATKKTAALFSNLIKNREKGYMVGHQDALAYGVKWKYIPGKSDIKEVVGEYPALYGWELGHLETGAHLNLDSVPFDKMKSFIREGYSKGGIISLSWHGDNPLTGKSAWDPFPGTVSSILPGGAKYETFLKQLDRVAAFLADLKGKKGEPIPVLFRPFHELTGHWFWWGAKSCSPEEYIRLFRFTIDYLRVKKKLHNLIVVYNTGNEIRSKAEFLDRYPGDDYVDVLSFDTYQHSKIPIDTSFVNKLRECLSIVDEVARERNKLAAVGEIGFNQIPYNHWFTEVLQPSLRNFKIAYVLLWRNAGYKSYDGSTEFYVPYPGHSSAPDFVRFYRSPETFFEKDARKLKIYK
ncbi:glycosyl hydrolase [Pedobacter sp. P351]|uniref:glycoside hydrolase family 26 protein n=1 Tax=Pedobacter superstes TaxID=3133441 RepID=UPI0030A72683